MSSLKVTLDIWQERRTGSWFGCLPDQDYRQLSVAMASREAVIQWAGLVIKRRGDDREFKVTDL